MRKPKRETIVGAYEAKTHFSKLLERVEGGEEVLITRHGAPVARLIPITEAATPEKRRAAIDHWRKTSATITLGGLRIRDLIAEGRR